ncbi:MAG: glycoside hydrolase family 28 protein [Bacteroidota bacterium]
MRDSVLIIIFFSIIISTQAKDFNILDFGAKGDGVFLNTEVIQKAVDKASKKGDSRVIIPKGTFLSGSIVLKSGVHLHLEEGAILLGSTDPAHYVKLNRWKAFLIADGQENIGITGKGTIDGQGREVALHLDSLFYAGKLDSAHFNFVERRPKYYTRPQLIEFVGCKGIEVREVTLKNAACWVQTHHECEKIIIDKVTTISDAYWNNDGIDIQDCHNVRITNCFVNAADDGICIKSHSADHDCDSIYIANCTVRSSASAVKFGTRSHGGFTNVHIKNIKVYDTFRSAIAIECVDGARLENVLVENIEATNTGNAIFIRLAKRYTKEVGTLKNVTLRNIKADISFERPDYAYELRGPALPFFHNIFPASITGIPGYPVENLTLENIEIHYPGKGNRGLAHMPISRLDRVPEKIKDYPEFSMFGELPAWGLYIRHIKGLRMKNIKIGIKEADYRPAMVLDDAHEVKVESLEIEGDKKEKLIILHNSTKVQFEEGEKVWEE